MSDKYDGVAVKVVFLFDLPQGSIMSKREEVAAILREAFPEPSPGAESGEISEALKSADRALLASRQPSADMEYSKGFDRLSCYHRR
jgi:hypothetical protein